MAAYSAQSHCILEAACGVA